MDKDSLKNNTGIQPEEQDNVNIIVGQENQQGESIAFQAEKKGKGNVYTQLLLNYRDRNMTRQWLKDNHEKYEWIEDAVGWFGRQYRKITGRDDIGRNDRTDFRLDLLDLYEKRYREEFGETIDLHRLREIMLSMDEIKKQIYGLTSIQKLYPEEHSSIINMFHTLVKDMYTVIKEIEDKQSGKGGKQ